MFHWAPVDWHGVFVPDTPLLEIFVRGSLTYLAIFVLLRVLLKRQSGGVSLTDILVVVLISDASQNAMAAQYRSWTDGILLVAVIIGWSAVLDLLGYYVPWIGRFVHPPALPLVRDGQFLRHNMRKEFVTEEELMSQLREQGIERVEQVKTAYIEGDGRISVLKKDGQQHPAPRQADPSG